MTRQEIGDHRQVSEASNFPFVRRRPERGLGILRYGCRQGIHCNAVLGETDSIYDKYINDNLPCLAE